MAKIYKIILMMLIIFSFSTIALAKELPTFNDTVENGRTYDGKTITVYGEAVGEAMKRGAYTWVNITDGTIPMGIWMKSTEAEKITLFGNYHYKGDMIEITGVINRACLEHGGDMDIHAVSTTIIEKGKIISHPINSKKVYISIALSALSILIGSFLYLRNKKQ